LEVRAVKVDIPRPRHSQAAAEKLTLSVVQVFEPKPPAGEAPVEWTLVSSEAIETLKDLAAMVDHYRARWVVEELFKALKSG
jgi:hypothetical protein